MEFLKVVLFLAVLGALDINWQVVKKLHPAPLYRLSSEPDYVCNQFHPFYPGSRDSRTAQPAVWINLKKYGLRFKP